MARLKSGYRKFKDGGAVPSEPTADVPAAYDPAIEAAISSFNAPELAKDWMRRNPEYLSDPEKNAQLQSLHGDVVDAGYEPYSAPYFAEIDRRLASGTP